MSSAAKSVDPIVTRVQCSKWGYHSSIWDSIIEQAEQAQKEGKFTDEQTAHNWVQQAFPLS